MEDTKLTMFILDSEGRKVLNLIRNKNLKSGWYNYSWNVSNLSSGMYYVHAIVNDKIIKKKIIIAN